MKAKQFIECSHSNMVSHLAKSGRLIKAELTRDDCHLIHMILGICGESGELLDAVKKAVIYRQDLDKDNVEEELGDIEFYLEGFRQRLGIKRLDTLRANIKKLKKRYPFYYTNKAAKERKDKA